MTNPAPATYNPNEIHHDWTAPTSVLGNQINIVAEDSPPHVMRNVASYYRQKGEPWADAMARRLVAVNDNGPAASAVSGRGGGRS